MLGLPKLQQKFGPTKPQSLASIFMSSRRIAGAWICCWSLCFSLCKTFNLLGCWGDHSSTVWYVLALHGCHQLWVIDPPSTHGSEWMEAQANPWPSSKSSWGTFGCLDRNSACLTQRDERPCASRTGRRPLLAHRLVACAAPARTELHIVWMSGDSVPSLFSHITCVWLPF
jgi:hypothetical protein